MMAIDKCTKEEPMPTYDRLRDNRQVLLEFIPNETLESYPYKDRYTLTLFTQGKLQFQLNGENFTLTAPFVLCVNQDDSFKVFEKGFDTRCQSVAFHPKFVNSSLDYETLEINVFDELEDQHDRDMMAYFNHRYECNGVFTLPASTYLRISEWIKLIGVESLTQSDWSWTCRIRRYLLQTMYLLDDIFMEQWREEQNGKKSSVDKALDYIHTNYYSCIELSDVCSVSGTNRTKLNKEFKERTGTTVINYLSNYRIDIAKRALTHTGLSLNELADALGYRYESYFIKQFTKIVGCTPTEYRQQNSVKRDPHGWSLEG